ncbi:T9SS type A sorting domain-containing protein [bacterium]|nr:T9SS type A sorting domain-containing protein [bacterium]
MKLKFTTLVLLFFAMSASVSEGADLFVSSGGAGTCLTVGSPCSITTAIGLASPGDTINFAAGLYSVTAGIDISLNYLTLKGPQAGVPASGRTKFVFPATCNVAEACLVAGPLVEYLFSIQADNVTIDGFDLVGDVTKTWAGVKIEGGFDRWTIDSNIVQHIGQEKTTVTGNYSYGVFGDANPTTNGTATMTGGEIVRNHFVELGRQNLPKVGAHKSAGMGIHLEGVSGLVTSCTAPLKFACGVWVHLNQFDDLATGQNQANFTFDVNGKEYATGVNIIQDAQNSSPNNGALVEGNQYNKDTFPAPDTKMDRGVVIGIGGSAVTEANASMLADVDAYVTNIDRKATISELVLADFHKTLHPTLFGPGSDMYFEDPLLAVEKSDPTASIVFLSKIPVLAPALAFEDYRITVSSGSKATSASYKVSLDSKKNLNLRQGAKLLFDGIKSNGVLAGVTEIILDGTSGNDLLTIDFSNGNPTPRGSIDGGGAIILPGVKFDGKAGFDKIVLRGDEQLSDETIAMTGKDSGIIYFEPQAGPGLARTTFTQGTTTNVEFLGLEPIDDVLIVNGAYAITAPDNSNNEINVVNGPFRFGFETFQVNSGQNATFEEVNFANKKNVHIHGSDETAVASAVVGDDVITLFTDDGDAPKLLLNINLYGGSAADDRSDDYFVVRPSKDFEISVNGGSDFTDDYLFLDCAKTDALCDPAGIAGLPATYSALSGVGFKNLTIATVEKTADSFAPGTDLDIKKELVGFATNGAHPGDDLQYKVTVTNRSGATITTNATPIWITDVVDHRLSLVEQSIVVSRGTVQVAGTNTAMLWKIGDLGTLAAGESVTMTYKVIVNTLITTNNIQNYASILNANGAPFAQYNGANGATLEDIAFADLDVLPVYGFPIKAAIQASLFYQTEAGPRYMVGLYGGAKDPQQGNLGSLLCRVPDTNASVGWDGGLGNLWYSCGKGLPAKDNLFSPLVVTDMFQDSAGRIWLTTWGFDGLFYSDDGAQTWTSANVDLSGGIGGAPDGQPDGFAQIYAITEDILGTLFISANNGEVYRSFDRGVTWQKAKQLPRGSADTAYSLEADPTVPGKLYAGTFGDGLYITNDFAETWAKPASAGLLNGYIYDIEIDPLSGNLFVGTAKGIFYSSDNGANWTGLNTAFPFPTNPPEIRAIAFDGNGQLFASTWGQGVWSSADWQATSLSLFALKESRVYDMAVSNGVVFTLGENGETSSFRYSSSARSTGIDDGFDNEVPTDFALDQNYPNPFNPTTSIQFNLPATQNVNLSVFDVLGRRVATLVNGQMAAGRHNVTFEASNLPSGMYLYRLSTPNGSISQKMILMK